AAAAKKDPERGANRSKTLLKKRRRDKKRKKKKTPPPPPPPAGGDERGEEFFLSEFPAKGKEPIPETTTEAKRESGQKPEAKRNPGRKSTLEKNSPPGRAARFTPEFEEFWRGYPMRAGKNPKPEAYSEWEARLADGYSLEEIMTGAGRYAAFLQAEGKTGTRFVMSTRSFLTDDDPPPFMLEWKIEKSAGRSQEPEEEEDDFGWSEWLRKNPGWPQEVERMKRERQKEDEEMAARIAAMTAAAAAARDACVEVVGHTVQH
ncbi:MAG: hypothetical protein HQL73_09060, partial [Magnetococcales bacterium]|nr:hypothetical protein [Magnetococcales bacterium]